MKYIIQYMFKPGLVVAMLGLVLVSCNKDLPEPTPKGQGMPAGYTAFELLSDPAYSTFIAAVNKAGLADLLKNPKSSMTIFAPDNAAFTASGIPAAAIAALPAAQLRAILSYHIIGGENYKAAEFSDKFPNNYLQSTLMALAPNAAVPMGYRVPIFVSRRGTSVWANNIPVTQADIVGSNGVIHKVARVVAPPQQTLWGYLDTASQFEYLKAAVIRADSGNVTAGTRLQDYLDLGAANFTLFAPNDDVFQATLYQLVHPVVYQMIYAQVYQGQIAGGAPEEMAEAAANAYATANAPAQTNAIVGTPDVFKNPALFPVLTKQLVQAVVSYHLLGFRAFAVNFPAGQSNYPSVAGNLLPNVQVTIDGSSFQVRGPGNIVVPAPGTVIPYSAVVVTRDQNFVNGVIHVIDKLLLPIPL